uniref:Uncharacterized protein n=1 Tax=Anguilla anguilla TaxID=7936 RepID=A0A0E9RST9_ANGAN
MYFDVQTNASIIFMFLCNISAIQSINIVGVLLSSPCR